MKLPSQSTLPRFGEMMRIGEVLDGKYRIDRLVGESGMGIVFEASDLSSSTRVAIKYIHPHVAARSESVERFLTEARLTAELDTPYVAPVLAAGRTQYESPYYVRQFIDGTDLETLAEETGGRLEVGRAVRLIEQVCRGLAAAHEHNLYHWNLKPQNVLVSNDSDGGERAVVVDFGVAGLRESLAEEAEEATVTGAVLGMPRYMPMEQARALRDRDHRIDIYATGLMLYELLTGEPAFEAQSFTQLLLLIATQEPTPLHEKRPALGEGLSSVVHRAIERESHKRFATALEFAEALTPYRDVELDDAPLEPPKKDIVQTRREIPAQRPSAPPSPAPGKEKRKSRQRWIWIGSAVVAGLLIAVLTVALAMSRRAPPAVLAADDVSFQDDRGGQGWDERCFYHLDAKRLANARAACLRGLDVAEDQEIRASLLYNLGRISIKQGDDRRARQYLQKSLELRPEFQAAREKLGELDR